MAGRPKAARRARKVRTNLRPPASSFFGRSTELDRLAALFDDARLVTLVGPGGIGKTRLAQRHAEQRLVALGRPDRGGVWFVDLVQVESAVDALAAMADVLGVDLAGRAGERAMSQAIGLALASLGAALVVVDNLEQLGPAAPRLVAAWLELAPSTRFLVTSRVVLGLPAEHVVTLGPLALEDARALFVERASAVRGVERLEHDPAHVDDIVESIDRMPLAIELAASRMRVLSTEELRQRLERPSEILTGGVTNARHASVRRAIHDSLALLPASVRRFFALASVLRNGFDLAAAESTLAAIAARPVEVLDSLDTLVRTSLLRVDLANGEPARYSFFDTIREVARDLSSRDPDLDAVRDAHARHYAALAMRAGRGSHDGLPLLERELENLLAAAATSSLRARSRADDTCARDAVAIALAIEPILSRRGLSALRERLFTEALELVALAGDHARWQAEIHLGRGLARRELGEVRGAEQDYEAALASCDTLDDRGLRATALMRLAGIWDVRGDTARARRSLDESIASLLTTPDDALRSEREAEALLRLGHAHRREGSLDAAHTAFSAAADRHRSLGRSEGLASALYELGVVEMFRARAEAAFAHFDEGLGVARRAGARVMEGACLTARGCLLQDLGRLGEALTHHAEAASLFRERGSRYREASALYYLATTYLEREEPAEALAVLDQARRRIEGVGAPRYDALMRSACALAHAASGRHDESAHELEQAMHALASVPHEPALVTALELHQHTLSVRAGRGCPSSLESARTRVTASPSDDARFALRELERALGRATVRAHEALCVWGAAEAFAIPGGTRVALPARSPLRHILELLVRRREVAPGEPVPIEAIIEAGWPGEKIGSDAALNRAYVALAALRKRGLRDVLSSSGGGYAISRGVMVRRMDEP